MNLSKWTCEIISTNSFLFCLDEVWMLFSRTNWKNQGSAGDIWKTADESKNEVHAVEESYNF